MLQWLPAIVWSIGVKGLSDCVNWGGGFGVGSRGLKNTKGASRRPLSSKNGARAYSRSSDGVAITMCRSAPGGNRAGDGAPTVVSN